MSERNEKVAERLRALRGDRTQQELANELGISSMAISQYEQGKRIPNDEIKIRIARFFGVTIDSIFFDL